MKGLIRREEIQARIPIIGMVKTGYKNDRGLPQSVDHFLIESEDANYKKKVYDVYGEKPTKLSIFFPGDNFEHVCNERYVLRTSKSFDGVGGRLFAQGDGEEFRVYSKDLDSYEIVNVTEKEKFMDDLAKMVKKEWEVNLTLRFFIIGLEGIWGAWQYSTKGEASTIPQIISVAQMVYNTAGRLAGIPFDLMVKVVTSQKPGTTSKFPVVTLIPNFSQEQLEKVKEIGNSITGVLTAERITQIAQTYQIEDKTISEENQSECLSHSPSISPSIHGIYSSTSEKVADAFQGEIKTKAIGNIEEAEKRLRGCKSLSVAQLTAKDLLNNFVWDKEQKEKLKSVYDEIAVNLK